MRQIVAVVILLIGCHSTPATPDYTTNNGIDVFVGLQNQPTQEQVESWTQEALDRWLEIKPNWSNCSKKAIEQVTVTFEDKYPTECPCGPQGETIEAKGYTTANLTIFIGNNEDLRSRIFLHEVGHVVAWVCGGIWANAHQFFEGIKYGY